MMPFYDGWCVMQDSGPPAAATQDFLCLALRKNIAVNTALTTYLRPEMLSARTLHAGFTVAQHLAHLCNDVKQWVGHVDSERAELLPTLVLPREHDNLSTEWLEQLQRNWNGAEHLVVELVTECRVGEKGTLPHPSIEMYAVHLLIHDSYHRGQMMAALKAAGYVMPDPDASLWTVWRS